MSDEKLDKKVQIDDPPIGGGTPTSAEPPPVAKEPTAAPSKAPAKPGPGRPRKDEPPRDPKPEPPPRPRKPDSEIRDNRGAIDRAIQTLSVCSKAYQVEHPESDLAWMWKQLRAALPEEKGRVGAPIDESAFAPLVRGPVRGVEMIGDLSEEEKATKEEINEVAQSWARASTHLGLSERVAAIGSAVAKTGGLVIRQVTRTIVKMTEAPPAKPETPTEAPAFSEEKKEENEAKP